LKVSIITVCKNASSTIGDTLNSVKSQTWRDIEHIILDGSSSDNTLDIVAKFSHVSCVFSEKDDGLYFAMNKAMSIATGDIVGILNADDIYTDEFVIENIVEVFSNASCNALYGDLVYVERDNLNKIVRYWKSGSYHSKSFYNGWSLPHPTFFVRREMYAQYGMFDTRFSIAADYELTLRFLLKNKVEVFYLNKVLVKMRLGGISNVTWKSRIIGNLQDRKAWQVNDLKPHLFTLILKPLSKIIQFKFPWQK
jgi:glycosyltransferase involved in cell wall biosynthesis